MIHLLNLLAAVSLLVLGTYIVRTGVMRVFGSQLRRLMAGSFSRRVPALMAGVGVTSLVQSSTATCMILTAFIDKKLVSLATALAVILGADIGSSLMAVVLTTFSLSLSFLSPLLIVAGVVMFVSGEQTNGGRIGRVLTGLGLITLALQLVVHATGPMTTSGAVRALIAALPDDVMLHMVIGAVLAVMAYSSAATVLLVATLAASGVISTTLAFGLVLGANIGGGAIAVLSTARSSIEARRLPVGNFAFKLTGAFLAAPALTVVHNLVQQWVSAAHYQVVLFHLLFNVSLAVLFIGLTEPVGRLVTKLLSKPKAHDAAERPRHLDPTALKTPALAISCAAREALHQADVVETMLASMLPVIRENDVARLRALRKMDSTVDELYTAIKFYLTQISRDALTVGESRRWNEVMSFTINMEQIGDIVERVLEDVEDKKIRKHRSFSDAGMAEIAHLHEQLLANMRLGMSVFLDGRVQDAQRLRQEKTRFRNLEHEYTGSHIARLRDNTAQSIETSSLHLDLIADFKSINSHICSIAYPVLEAAGLFTGARSIEPDESPAPGNPALVSLSAVPEHGFEEVMTLPEERHDEAVEADPDFDLPSEPVRRNGAQERASGPVAQAVGLVSPVQQRLARLAGQASGRITQIDVPLPTLPVDEIDDIERTAAEPAPLERDLVGAMQRQ